MNTYKLTYPDSPCVHTFQSGDDLVPFCERTFGSIEAMIARGVVVDHPDFNAIAAASAPAKEEGETPVKAKTKKGGSDAN